MKSWEEAWKRYSQRGEKYGDWEDGDVRSFRAGWEAAMQEVQEDQERLFQSFERAEQRDTTQPGFDQQAPEIANSGASLESRIEALEQEAFRLWASLPPKGLEDRVSALETVVSGALLAPSGTSEEVEE